MVGILADAPTLTTGFGRTTRRMADSLARAGHDVAVFGLKAGPADAGEDALPYRVWPAEQRGHWSETLASFFATTEPDVLVMNMDAYNALECVERCAAAGWRGPTVSYVCFDGLPIAERYLHAQRRCAAVWTTSNTGATFLRERGIEVAGVAQPGVDPEQFAPAPDRNALRALVGLDGALVVGVFATNTERKQIVRAIHGFARAALPADSRLYLHCAPLAHWDVGDHAERAGVADRLLLPAGVGFDERRGLPELDYVGRLNVCDVIVNVPHSGDIEQVILEAQACGVPLLHTADDAVMSEALADGGLPLRAFCTLTGRVGQTLHFVDPDTIAQGLQRVLGDHGLRTRLCTAGQVNVVRYVWDVLERAALEMVRPFVTARCG